MPERRGWRRWGFVAALGAAIASGCASDADDAGPGDTTGGDGDAPVCVADGSCELTCPSGVTDPDCPTCACDREDGRCDADHWESTNACACDLDCDGGDACETDASCDEFCLARDSDCLCSCHLYRDVCEADGDHSSAACTCDPDCAGGSQACVSDGHCDAFCDPTNPGGTPVYACVDPDCDLDPGDGHCR